jgi:hypothetical protein
MLAMRILYLVLLDISHWIAAITSEVLPLPFLSRILTAAIFEPGAMPAYLPFER